MDHCFRKLTCTSAAALLLLSFGCGGAPEGLSEEEANLFGHADATNPHELIGLELEGKAVEEELLSSPSHDAGSAFNRLGVVFDSPQAIRLEISTSPDGVTWAPWQAVEAASQDGTVYAGALEVERGTRIYKVRVDGNVLPTFLSIEAQGEAAMDDQPGMLDDPLHEVSSGNGTATDGHGLAPGYHEYRFDQGKVTGPWLWLLKTARRAGWSGHLSGSRTGLRTYAQQAALYRDYLAGRGAPAFSPNGPSRHMIHNVRRIGDWSMAVDTQAVPQLISIAARHGVRLHRPYSYEPWHVEAIRRFSAPRGWQP